MTAHCRGETETEMRNDETQSGQIGVRRREKSVKSSERNEKRASL